MSEGEKVNTSTQTITFDNQTSRQPAEENPLQQFEYYFYPDKALALLNESGITPEVLKNISKLKGSEIAVLLAGAPEVARWNRTKQRLIQAANNADKQGNKDLGELLITFSRELYEFYTELTDTEKGLPTSYADAQGIVNRSANRAFATGLVHVEKPDDLTAIASALDIREEELQRVLNKRPDPNIPNFSNNLGSIEKTDFSLHINRGSLGGHDIQIRFDGVGQFDKGVGIGHSGLITTEHAENSINTRTNYVFKTGTLATLIKRELGGDIDVNHATRTAFAFGLGSGRPNIPDQNPVIQRTTQASPYPPFFTREQPTEDIK